MCLELAFGCAGDGLGVLFSLNRKWPASVVDGIPDGDNLRLLKSGASLDFSTLFGLTYLHIQRENSCRRQRREVWLRQAPAAYRQTKIVLAKPQQR